MPAQVRAHASQQFARAERLDEIVICACIQRFDLVLFRCSRGEHENRCVRPCTKVFDKVDAIAIGKAEIEHHQVRTTRTDFDQAAFDAVGFEDFEAAPALQ